MLRIDREIAAAAQPPSADRVRGLQRVIPRTTIQSILKRTGQHRHCPRLPKWFMVWFVIGLGLFATDGYRQVFRRLQAARAKPRTPSAPRRAKPGSGWAWPRSSR